jgi:hypothetical protein
MLEMKHKKTLAGIFQNAAVEKYYPQLIQCFTKPDIVFDDYLCIMNFNNGYMDFEDLKFKPRTVGKHYISKYIHRDYVASTKTDQETVLSHVRKIYPDQEDLNCITSILGSALSGKSTNDQDLLFLLGEGSSGKSFILEITGLAIDCYFKELKDDTFAQQNNKIDKMMSIFLVMTDFNLLRDNDSINFLYSSGNKVFVLFQIASENNSFIDSLLIEISFFLLLSVFESFVSVFFFLFISMSSTLLLLVALS